MFLSAFGMLLVCVKYNNWRQPIKRLGGLSFGSVVSHEMVCHDSLCVKLRSVKVKLLWSRKMVGTPEWLSDLGIESGEPIEVGREKKGINWNILRVNIVCWRRKLNMTRMRRN